jgi:hypothetical protein
VVAGLLDFVVLFSVKGAVFRFWKIAFFCFLIFVGFFSSDIEKSGKKNSGFSFFLVF